jgi:hypothetical protein
LNKLQFALIKHIILSNFQLLQYSNTPVNIMITSQQKFFVEDRIVADLQARQWLDCIITSSVVTEVKTRAGKVIFF